MAYATTTDVQGLLPQLTFSAISKPTSTQLGVILDDISAEMDVALANAGVATLPYVSDGSDGGDAFATWLGKVCADGASATALKAAFPNVTGPMETPAYAFFEKRYQTALKSIQDGTMMPTASGGAGTDAVPASYATRYANEEADDGVIGTPRIRFGDSAPESTRY